MNDLINFYENDTDILYSLIGVGQGLVSIPKDLKDDIKLFLVFKDSVSQETERRKLVADLQSISKSINKNNDAILLFSLMPNNFLLNENIVNYGMELTKIKKSVNMIYNKLLGEGKLKKENFIKKIEILSLDNKYRDFSNWLCKQNPEKFHLTEYKLEFKQDVPKKQTDVFSSQSSASIFNEPTNQSTMMGMHSNTKANEQSLSIGTPNLTGLNFSTNPNAQKIHEKNLVRNYPNNHGSSAFIKWYTTLFILIGSLVIGIIASLILIK